MHVCVYFIYVHIYSHIYIYVYVYKIYWLTSSFFIFYFFIIGLLLYCRDVAGVTAVSSMAKVGLRGRQHR